MGTIQSSSNFADRATSKTLKEMTNPFLSRVYNQQDSDNSNIYSYHASHRVQQQQQEDDEEFRHPDSNGQSSSSMSGYDIKGMLQKQQSVARPMHQPAKSFAIP